MRQQIVNLKARVKPKRGFSPILHFLYTTLLPALVLVLVRWRFALLALLVILLSKWRIFAVKPRHWPANIRLNAVDIMVGVSLLGFQLSTTSAGWQFFWTFCYGLWLSLLKSRSSLLAIASQAFIGQTLGLIALFLYLGDSSRGLLIILSWIICYFTARHFFGSFDERLVRLFAYSWGFFAASLVWLLSHWLLFYGVIAQPAVLITVLGFGLGTLYYLDTQDRLSMLVRRQCIFIMIAIITIILAFADWGDKTI